MRWAYGESWDIHQSSQRGQDGCGQRTVLGECRQMFHVQYVAREAAYTDCISIVVLGTIRRILGHPLEWLIESDCIDVIIVLLPLEICLF